MVRVRFKTVEESAHTKNVSPLTRDRRDGHASAEPISAAFQTGFYFEAGRRHPNFGKPGVSEAKEYSAAKNG